MATPPPAAAAAAAAALSRVSEILGRSSAAAAAAENKAKRALSLLINEVLRERDPTHLRRKFMDFANRDPRRFSASRSVYVTTFRRLAAAGHHSSIQEIVDAHTTSPALVSLLVDKEGFTVRLISLLGNCGMYSAARNLFDQLPLLGAPRSIWSFNTLLAAAIRSNLHATVLDLFTNLAPALSLKPNVVTYNNLVEAQCKMGSLDDAMATVLAMEVRGVIPSVITFNTVLNALYDADRFPDADRLLAKMKELDVSPDIITYNTKLRGLASCGRTSEAIQLLDRLPELGLKPDTFSYNALILGHCKDGNLEEAKKVFLDKMDYKQHSPPSPLSPNRWTYEVLIPKFLEQKELDLAFKMSKDCIEKKLYVSAKILQGVIDALLQDSKHIADAKTLWAVGCSNSYYRPKLVLPPT